MSVFTTEVRHICETASGLTESAGLNSVKNTAIPNIIDSAIPDIFDFNFPIFDESYRQEFEHKILRHFYTREIGYETVGLWKLKLEDTLNLIMPYYNKLYSSTLITYNPLYDIDYYRDGAKKDIRNTTAKSSENENISGTETSTDKYSDIGSKDEAKNKTKSNERNDTNAERNSNIKNGNTSDTYNETNESEKNKSDNNTSTNRKIFVGTDNGEASEDNNENNVNAKSSKNNTVTHNDNNSWNLFSDTPQSGVIGLANFGPNPNGSGTVEGNAYLTNATRDLGEGDGITDGTASETGSGKSVGHKDNTSEMVYNYDTKDSATKNGSETEVKNDTKEKSGSSTTKEISSENKDTNYSSNESGEESENSSVKDIRNKIGNSESENQKNREREKSDSQSASGKQDYAEHVYGKRGTLTYSKMIEDFRKAIINVDMMVMRELEPLFMGIWE